MNYLQQLTTISNDQKENALTRHVAGYILEDLGNYEGTDNANIKSWYNDLMQGGCASGFISELIYYTDTHAFFDKYSNDIFELWSDAQENAGEFPTPTNDVKNWFAWFGFEETAREIIENKLGMEV